MTKRANRIDWKLIALLSPSGLVMGWMGVRGFTGDMEPYLWLLFAVIAALVLGRNVPHRLFAHAFIIGFSWGVLNGWCQSAFFYEYLLNNPAYADDFSTDKYPIDARYFPLLTGPVIGVVTGFVLYLFSFVVKKVLK
jgi:uncharacterized membrane protein YfcA